ncbi:glycosyltransferase [Thioalkalivibrio sp. ALR17-21]|uniref:glycosyltransferase family 2 protein n=1 Tax=Thioalkalivibrio sp. ALR17-21 TaxID=1269813 RepID=UPI0003FBD7AB|nr:glycosyltransferase [Thioalkalivibrio sp. ALR17-21]
MTSPAGEAAMPEQQGRPRDDRATPDFSVVVPAFNCAAFLADALDSILAQEGVSVEVLVVDDGSTDNTAERARTYDARVRLLSTARPRSGPGAARNVGIRHARAPVVAFLDGDDVWLPGKLALQKRVLDENPDVALVCTRGAHWFPEREGDAAWQQAAPPESPASGEIPFRPAGWIYHLLLLRPAWVWTSTVVMRRELIERTGEFDETLRLGQDYDYWLRASRETRILRIDRILALYRQHADNSTHTPRARNFELEILQRALARWGRAGPDGSTVTATQLRERLAGLSFRFGYKHFWSGDPRIAFGAFGCAFRNQPLAWRTWAYIGASAMRSLWPPGRR